MKGFTGARGLEGGGALWHAVVAESHPSGHLSWSSAGPASAGRQYRPGVSTGRASVPARYTTTDRYRSGTGTGTGNRYGPFSRS